MRVPLCCGTSTGGHLLDDVGADGSVLPCHVGDHLANVWVDTDISRLDETSANSEVHFATLRRASRARFNVGVDTGAITFGLFITMFQIINVNCYLFGTPVNMLHGSTSATTNLKTYNHPLPYYGTTFDPYTVQQVNFRTNLHFFNVETNCMILAFWFAGRIFGIIVTTKNMQNAMEEKVSGGDHMSPTDPTQPSRVSGRHHHYSDEDYSSKNAVPLEEVVNNALGAATAIKAGQLHGINA